jgi:CBS domain-containing protein
MLSPQSQAYPALEGLRVVDAMHPGLISCTSETPLRTVARRLSTFRVHAILVTDHGSEWRTGGGGWRIVSDAALLQAARTGDLDRQPARVAAAAPALTVTVHEDLARAAELMAEHDVSHLVVVDPRSGRPVGVLSSLDLVRALAGFPEQHPAR